MRPTISNPATPSNGEATGASTPSRAAAAVVVAAASLLLAASALKGVDPGVVGSARDFQRFTAFSLQQLKCIDQAVRERLPRGTRVAVSFRDPYWRQRLIEMEYDWLKPVLDQGQAQELIEVSKVPEGEGCDGAQLRLTKLS